MLGRGWTITAVVVAALAAGCNGSDDPADPLDPSSPATSATPTDSDSPESPSTAGPETAAELVGEWSDKPGDFVLHFEDDGTFIMDFAGVKDFLHGTYTLVNGKVTLKNDEGEDTGSVQGESLVFQLGTVTRVTG